MNKPFAISDVAAPGIRTALSSAMIALDWFLFRYVLRPIFSGIDVDFL
jgi:hypothetical protein